MSSNPNQRLVDLQVEAAKEAVGLLLVILNHSRAHWWETKLLLSEQLIHLATEYRNAVPWPGDDDEATEDVSYG